LSSSANSAALRLIRSGGRMRQ